MTFSNSAINKTYQQISIVAYFKIGMLSEKQTVHFIWNEKHTSVGRVADESEGSNEKWINVLCLSRLQSVASENVITDLGKRHDKSAKAFSATCWFLFEWTDFSEPFFFSDPSLTLCMPMSAGKGYSTALFWPYGPSTQAYRGVHAVRVFNEMTVYLHWVNSVLTDKPHKEVTRRNFWMEALSGRRHRCGNQAAVAILIAVCTYVEKLCSLVYIGSSATADGDWQIPLACFHFKFCRFECFWKKK